MECNQILDLIKTKRYDNQTEVTKTVKSLDMPYTRKQIHINVYCDSKTKEQKRKNKRINDDVGHFSIDLSKQREIVLCSLHNRIYSLSKLE